MEWLNLHISTLDSHEVVGAEPVDRATWLFLLRYCIGQENRGVMTGCRNWGDGKWQQIVRVKLREVNRTTDLWRWEADDLHVNFYPDKKQAEVERKRQAGRDTAAKRWDKQPSSADSSATNSASGSADAEGKGREKEGKGSEPVGAVVELDLTPAFPPILDTPAFRAAWADYFAYRTSRRLAKLLPKSETAQLERLAGWGHDAAIQSIRETIAQQWQGLFEPKSKPGAQSAVRPVSAEAPRFSDDDLTHLASANPARVAQLVAQWPTIKAQATRLQIRLNDVR